MLSASIYQRANRHFREHAEGHKRGLMLLPQVVYLFHHVQLGTPVNKNQNIHRMVPQSQTRVEGIIEKACAFQANVEPALAYNRNHIESICVELQEGPEIAEGGEDTRPSFEVDETPATGLSKSRLREQGSANRDSRATRHNTPSHNALPELARLWVCSRLRHRNEAV